MKIDGPNERPSVKEKIILLGTVKWIVKYIGSVNGNLQLTKPVDNRLMIFVSKFYLSPFNPINKFCIIYYRQKESKGGL